MTEPDVGPIDKNAQYVILRRLGWVSPSREHFQNFDFIVILYFDAPRGMVSQDRDKGPGRPAGRNAFWERFLGTLCDIVSR